MTTRAPREPRRPLSGPYAARVGEGALPVSPACSDLVASQVDALLSSSAAFHELQPHARDELRRNLRTSGPSPASLVQEEFALPERLGQTPVLRRWVVAPPAGEPLARAAA